MLVVQRVLRSKRTNLHERYDYPVPLEPVQIILMELFMDLGASMTFLSEPPECDLMAQPPRDPRITFMDRAVQLGILSGGAVLGAAVLVGYVGAIELQASTRQAQTVAFIAWMVGHVVLAANMRTDSSRCCAERCFPTGPSSGGLPRQSW